MSDDKSLKQVSTDKAPGAVGPYSQAMISEPFLFTSGQIALDPATGEMVGGDIQDRARQVLTNVKAVAEAAGTGMDRAVKVTVFLTDMGDFAAVNEVYAQFFSEPFPARSCVAVAALPKGADVEVEAIFRL